MTHPGIPPVSRDFVTLGAIETRSIARGLLVVDAISKESPVEVLTAQPTSPGKFLVLITGEVDETERALAAGLAAAGDSTLDSVLLPAAHTDLVEGLRGRLGRTTQPVFDAVSNEPDGHLPALGIIETYTAPSLIAAVDTILKTGETALFQIHLLVGIGGKATAVVGGDVESVKIGLEAGAEFARQRDALAEDILIPRPDARVFATLRSPWPTSSREEIETSS